MQTTINSSARSLASTFFSVRVFTIIHERFQSKFKIIFKFRMKKAVVPEVRMTEAARKRSAKIRQAKEAQARVARSSYMRKVRTTLTLTFLNLNDSE